MSREIKLWKQPLSIKTCSEIRFSNGGHLFACTAGTTNKEIHIYNFYTNECPTMMQYVGHTNNVNSISWFENDLGFASTGKDGNIYFYDLYGPPKEAQKRSEDKDYLRKDVKFSCLSIIPGLPYEVLAVGSDKQIHNNNGKMIKG